jgi:hypothetical protein
MIANWSEYEAGLQQRGRLTVWISEDELTGWEPPRLVHWLGGLGALGVALTLVLAPSSLALPLPRCGLIWLSRVLAHFGVGSAGARGGVRYWKREPVTRFVAQTHEGRYEILISAFFAGAAFFPLLGTHASCNSVSSNSSTTST